jgi:two-component system, OmpR family, sensor kinase
MRRQLTIAILAVVVGTVLVTSAGSLFLVRRAAITTAESEITSQARTIGAAVSNHTIGLRRTLNVLGRVGDYGAVTVVGLGADGSFTSLPAPIRASLADPGALQDGSTVVGNVGNTVFALVPVALDAAQQGQFGVSAGAVPVLAVTRHIRSPVNGLGYFLLVAAGAVALSAVVAAGLARRISAPLVRAVGATRRIAGGDLAAKVELGPRDYPELAELARSINAMGESLERSRGLERQFLLSVSHELRTPLTSIRGYADALSEGMTDDMGAAVAVIGAEARRLERIVQDLLDLARLDARRFSFQPQPVDAAAVVAGVADGFRPEVGALGLGISVQIEPEALDDGLWIEADPDRLAQIVANLVENASKFATRRIEVGAAMTGVGGEVALWVADDGPGIRAEDMAQVFGRHFTSDRVPSRRVGTGLGLAIVAELSAAMGGRVRAVSPLADGRGTRMEVAFGPTGGDRRTT